MKFLEGFLSFILDFSENRKKVAYVSKRKKHFDNGCVLSIESLAESEKEKMEAELRLIFKASRYETSQLLKYIKTHGTNVFYLNNSFFLKLINVKEGFIYPKVGIKAFLLNLLLSRRISFKTDEMFVFIKDKIDNFYFAYHFYNWYAFLHNIGSLNDKAAIDFVFRICSEYNDNKEALEKLHSNN